VRFSPLQVFSTANPAAAAAARISTQLMQLLVGWCCYSLRQHPSSLAHPVSVRCNILWCCYCFAKLQAS
jgi:hypothetical protein